MGNADKRPLISVIVPIYNVENYLRACVDSIIAQTYDNLEIILVDDGSPDNCPAICDEYAEKDRRIKVIHKENGGLSDARNAGLSVMTGEYLMFVDSDDCLTDNAVEALYEIVNTNNCLLAIGGYQRFFSDDERFDTPKEVLVKTFSTKEAIQDMLLNGCASWGRLYHVSVHKDVLFPIGEINEDEAIVLQILNRCNKVLITNQIVYRYRCRPDSITTASFSEKKVHWYYHCTANLNWVRINYPDLEKYAIDRLGSCIVYLLHQMALFGYNDQNISSMLLGDLRSGYRKYQKYYLSGRKEKIRMWFLNCFPYSMYCKIISLIGRKQVNG